MEVPPPVEGQDPSTPASKVSSQDHSNQVIGDGQEDQALPASTEGEEPSPAGLYDPSQDPGASFEKVSEAYFFGQEKFNPDPVTMEWYRQARPHRYEAFVTQFGSIDQELYCLNTVAAVVLTGQDRIFSINNDAGEDAAAIVKLLNDAYHLEVEARQNLQGEALASDRRTVLEMLFTVFANTLALLDRTALIDELDRRRQARGERSKEFLNARDLLEHTRAFYERIAQRTAQIYYFRGMILAAGLILGLGISLAALLVGVMEANDLRTELALALGVFMAGGVGAVVSVMSRMTSGRLRLDHTVGWGQLSRLGAFRPFIGAFLSLALYVLVAGGLIPIAVSGDPAIRLYFYLGLAFLSGFSERFAQDMLSGAREALETNPSK